MDDHKSTSTGDEAKDYLAKKEIPQLFESMLTGLMYSRPDDPLEYLEECINKSKERGLENIMWDTFALKKDPLPPIPTSPGREEPAEGREKSFITQDATQEPESTKSTTLNPYQALPPISSAAHEQTEHEENVEVVEEKVKEDETELLGVLRTTLPQEYRSISSKYTRHADKPLFLAFIGTVGCGKENHFPYFLDYFGIHVVRVGDLIKKEVESGSDHAEELKELIEGGKDMPENMLVELIKKEVSTVGNINGFILDGFPRSTSVVEEFQSQVGEISHAFHFEQSDEEIQLALEQETQDVKGEDVSSFNSIITPVVDHFEQNQKLTKIPAGYGESEQWEMIQKDLFFLGFTSTEKVEGEIEEEVIEVEESAGRTGEDEGSIPVQDPVREFTFVCLLKGPQSDSSGLTSFLKEEHGFTPLNISQLMEAEINKDSIVGKALKKAHIQSEDNIDDLVFGVVLSNLVEPKPSEKILLEGFPQSPEQARMFQDTVGKISFAIYLEHSDEEMKAAYKSTDSQLSDSEVDAEIESFRKNISPVVEYLDSQHLLFKLPGSEFSGDTFMSDETKEKLVSKIGTDTTLFPLSMQNLTDRLRDSETAATHKMESSDISDLHSVFENLPVIFVTGGPGSGKGTQCDKIVKEFNFTHLSSGDLLRAKVASGSKDGQELDAIMKEGKLVPLEKVLDLITEAMTNAVAAGPCNGFLIDGYPREIEQGLKFEAKIKPASLVIDFDVPDEVMVERLINRGKTSGRLDDNEETIKARLKTYREATVPVADHYSKEGKLVRIDANRDPEMVFADVAKTLKSVHKFLDAFDADKGTEQVPLDTSSEEAKPDLSDTSSTLEKLPVVFVTGGPGSGKGTQCEKIVKEFGFTHLSSGDLLRAKVASGSEDGKELEAIMKEGKLVPLEKVLDLITEAMNSAVASGSCNGFLIDGYPREIEQGLKFEEKIKPASLVIDFDVPDEVMVERLVKRGETSGRQDDNEETIKARLQTYREATVPVADHYQKQGKLAKIDANRDPESVFADVATTLKNVHSFLDSFGKETGEEPEEAPAETADESEESSEMKGQLAKLPVIFVTGGPGSGKGTQCDKIVKEFNFTHLSSGDLLRAKVASGSKDGQELDAIMKEGKLVPLEKVLDLITEAMTNAVAAGPCNGFLIDGYPREIEQGLKFEAKIKPASLVIDFDVPDEVMVERLINRGKTSGRLDDNEETIKARLKTYREATVPVADHYQKQGKLIRIDANRSPDQVFGDVVKAFATIGLKPSAFSQPVFFIVGGPGSGKGTQCEKMVAEFHFTHLSSGDLLRAEVASGSEKGKALDADMKAGKLVTTETVLELMKAAMDKERTSSKGYLIDGYPRKVDQGELFEKMVAPCAACIFFDVPAEVMKERLLKRAETSGRADDNEETITKRLVTFDNETKPVLTYYKQAGKLHDINAERTVDEIYADVRQVLLPFVQS